MDADDPLLPEQSTATRSKIGAHIRKRQSLLLLCCALLLVTSILGIYALSLSPEFNQYRLLRTYQSHDAATSNAQAPRTMLLWNNFFDSARWGLPEDTLGPAFFRDELQCPVYHCELTNVRDFLPSLDMFDAVLFHTAEPFPLLNSVPAERSSQQLYVFALMEPPGETKHVLSDEGDFYNLTMTYRLDSDVVWPYKTINDILSGAVVAPAKAAMWRQPPTHWNDTAVRKLWSGKTKEAAWFVSHCDTLSRREKLAAELQKYIGVDIYGKCGTLSCPYTAKQCDNLLDEKYKFYLSFENSLCTDYVSEKLYNALERNVIPVVFGGANYTRFLPPHSYINVENFESVKSLAAYLRYLSTHEAEYMRYFWWRRHYRLGALSPYCDLCEKLHSTAYRQKTQTYRNIEEWWLADTCRYDAKIKF